MPHYVISGKPDCPNFVHAIYVAQYLANKLPNFVFKKVEKLSKDWAFFLENTETAGKRAVQVISILGASNPQTCFLINEIVEITTLSKSQGIVFKLFDYYQNIDNKKYDNIVQYAAHLNEGKIFGKDEMVIICETKTQVMQDADIVINLEEFAKHDIETEDMFLKRCYCRMEIFADFVNNVTKRSAKIIMANNGPVCFLSTCLLVACRPKKFKNIVAITADKGFPYINSVSTKTGIPIHRISAPTVWGFVGTNHFVDVRNIVYEADMYKPFKRSLNSPKGSTLPLGIAHSEIRMMSYLLKSSDDIINEVEDFTKQLQIKLRRPPIFSKVRAIVSLLKLWFADEIGDEIISLGVSSDGSFDIPRGIIFSQPVTLDQSRKWVPFTNFPLMNEVTKSEIKHCCTRIYKILEEFKLLDILEADRKRLFETEEEFDAYERYLGHLQTQGEHLNTSASSDQSF